MAQGHGEHPAATSRRKTLGKKFTTTKQRFSLFLFTRRRGFSLLTLSLLSRRFAPHRCPLECPPRALRLSRRASCHARAAATVATEQMQRLTFSHALLLCACVSSAAGFSAPHASATRPRAELLAVRRQAVTVSMIEEIPRPDAGRFPFRTVVLGLLSLQSAIGLTADNELGGLITRFTDATLVTNYFNTFFDSAFFAYGANTLLNQAGLIKENPKTSSVTLSDMEVQITR